MPRTNDRFLPFGVAIICLAGGWGSNIYATQAMIMVIVAFCALFLCLRDWVVGALGVYMSVWYMVLYSTGLAHPVIVAESVTLMGFGMLAYVLVRTGSTPIETYLDMIILVACVLCVLGLVGYSQGKPAVATLGNQNFLGAFLAISVFACFRPKRWYYMAILLPALWFCESSMPIAALCAGVGFYAWRWRGVMVMAFPALLYGGFVDAHQSFDRLTFWGDAIGSLTASWWTVIVGFGPGIPWNPGNGMLHSEYVNLAWNLGIVGLVIVGYYFWRALRSENRILTAMIMAVLVDGLGNHIMHTAPTAILAIMVMGLNDRSII